MFDPRAPKLVERNLFREKQVCAHRKTFRFAGYINDQSTRKAVNENGLFSFPVDRGPRQQDPHRTELGLMGPQILLPFTQGPPIHFQPQPLGLQQINRPAPAVRLKPGPCFTRSALGVTEKLGEDGFMGARHPRQKLSSKDAPGFHPALAVVGTEFPKY
jgi:hypothetical protein